MSFRPWAASGSESLFSYSNLFIKYPFQNISRKGHFDCILWIDPKSSIPAVIRPPLCANRQMLEGDTQVLEPKCDLGGTIN